MNMVWDSHVPDHNTFLTAKVLLEQQGRSFTADLMYYDLN